eukprot:1239182-Prymnesium_polylepis.1
MPTYGGSSSLARRPVASMQSLSTVRSASISKQVDALPAERSGPGWRDGVAASTRAVRRCVCWSCSVA